MVLNMATIQIKTEIPGPRSRALMKRRDAAVPRAPYNTTPVFAAAADGATITDVDGNRYIDFAGGIGCLNIGHQAPRVTAAIREQLEKHLHLCFAVTPYEGYIAVAEKLNALTPGNFAKKTILLNTGAEAVENAVKIARAYTKRPAIICFEDAFHGRTLMAMSLTSKAHPYKAGFEPFASDVYRIPFAYEYRAEGETTTEAFAHHLENAFKRSVAAESVAAIIAEPVLGEGGFVVPPRDYFKALQAICRRHGILFIADEVQSGFARTGTWFASEHFGVEPDLITMAKSLGGGMPIAAVTGRAEIMDAPAIGGLAARTVDIRFRARRRWLQSKRSKKKACWRDPPRLANISRSVREAGRKSGSSSGRCADLAECALSSWFATRKRVSRPITRPNRSRRIATSTA